MFYEKAYAFGVLAIIVLVFLVFLPLNQLVKVEVSNVVDGDTFDAEPGGRIRLADVDTPERGEPGYAEATDYLNSKLLEGEVYLNIDDLYGVDTTSKRVVAVVYVRREEGLLNVNKALLDGGFAVFDDYPNEFHPFIWILDWPITLLPETYFIQVTITIVIIVLAALLGKNKILRKL
jgi:hypothetical protein